MGLMGLMGLNCSLVMFVVMFVVMLSGSSWDFLWKCLSLSMEWD